MKYTLKKAVIENEEFYEWETYGTYNTYEEAEAEAIKMCGKDYDTEPSQELKKSFFGTKGENSWRCRIIIKK